MSIGKVSVILATYNSGSRLTETVHSILNQTFADFDLFIVDDASTDGTYSTLKEFADNDPRIILSQNKTNLGVGETYQVLLHLARGQYFSQIGHDDIWHPEFLETCVRELDENPEAAACFAQVELVTTGTQKLPLIIRLRGLFAHQLIGELSYSDLAKRLFRGNFLAAPGAVSRSSAMQGWDTFGANDTHQDWHQCLDLIPKGPFLFCDRVLTKYFVHGTNVSFQEQNVRQMYDEILYSQFAMLRSSSFADYILKAADPSRELADWFIYVRQTMFGGPWKINSLLRIILHDHEAKLGALASYRTVYGLTLWDQGELNKAMRYFDRDLSVISHFRATAPRKYICVWSFTAKLRKNSFLLKPEARDLIRVYNFGFCKWVGLQTSNPHLCRFSLSSKIARADLAKAVENALFRKEFGFIKLKKILVKGSELVFSKLLRK